MTGNHLVIALLVGVTSLTGAGTDAQMPPTVNAEAPIFTRSGKLAQPVAGSGQIVFFRPRSVIGAALGCTVREGAKEIARLGSGKYYVVNSTIGQHAFFTGGGAPRELILNVAEGATYFVKCAIGKGVLSGRATLSASDRDTFVSRAESLSLWAGPKKDAPVGKQRAPRSILGP